MPNIKSITCNIACTIGSVISHPLTQTAASVAFGLYGGPVAAVVARNAFPLLYASSVASVPARASFAYWALYAPAREHFVSKAFVWGPKAAVVAAPVVGSGVKYLASSLWSHQIAKTEANTVIQAPVPARITVGQAV